MKEVGPSQGNKKSSICLWTGVGRREFRRHSRVAVVFMAFPALASPTFLFILKEVGGSKEVRKKDQYDPGTSS